MLWRHGPQPHGNGLWKVGQLSHESASADSAQVSLQQQDVEVRESRPLTRLASVPLLEDVVYKVHPVPRGLRARWRCELATGGGAHPAPYAIAHYAIGHARNVGKLTISVSPHPLPR